MKKEEKKNVREEAKKERKPEAEDGEKLTDEEMAQVAGGLMPALVL